MAAVLYREEQWFPQAIGVLIGAMAAAGALALAFGRAGARAWACSMLSASGSILSVLAVFAPMRTTVTPEGVLITFGLPSWIRFRIRADAILGVEETTYRPLADFGGWGIRFALDGTRAYTARGNRGVRVHTAQRDYLIGSQRPEALAAALRQIQGGLAAA